MGRITLTATDKGGTQWHTDYEAEIGGKVASVGGRLLDGAAKVVIGQFFAALARHARRTGPVRASLFDRSVREARMKPARSISYVPKALPKCTKRLPRTAMSGRVMAGGQSLVPMLNMRLARPELARRHHASAGIGKINADSKSIAIGAGVRQAELLDLAGTGANPAAFGRAALPWVGHVQTRSRGTVCGSVAHADPSAETAAVPPRAWRQR